MGLNLAFCQCVFAICIYRPIEVVCEPVTGSSANRSLFKENLYFCLLNIRAVHCFRFEIFACLVRWCSSFWIKPDLAIGTLSLGPNKECQSNFVVCTQDAEIFRPVPHQAWVLPNIAKTHIWSCRGRRCTVMWCLRLTRKRRK